MRIAGVDEQFGEFRSDLVDDLTRSIDVSLEREKRILVHSADLTRNTVGPWPARPLTSDRSTSPVNAPSASAIASLCQPMPDTRSEPKPGVPDLNRQFGHDLIGALAEHRMPAS